MQGHLFSSTTILYILDLAPEGHVSLPASGCPETTILDALKDDHIVLVTISLPRNYSKNIYD